MVNRAFPDSIDIEDFSQTSWGFSGLGPSLGVFGHGAVGVRVEDDEGNIQSELNTGTDYTVAVTNSDSGSGIVTLTTAGVAKLSEGSKFRIFRSFQTGEIIQTLSFVNLQKLNPASIEAGLDKVSRILQFIIGSCCKGVPVGSMVPVDPVDPVTLLNNVIDATWNPDTRILTIKKIIADGTLVTLNIPITSSSMVAALTEAQALDKESNVAGSVTGSLLNKAAKQFAITPQLLSELPAAIDGREIFIQEPYQSGFTPGETQDGSRAQLEQGLDFDMGGAGFGSSFSDDNRRHSNGDGRDSVIYNAEDNHIYYWRFSDKKIKRVNFANKVEDTNWEIDLSSESAFTDPNRFSLSIHEETQKIFFTFNQHQQQGNNHGPRIRVYNISDGSRDEAREINFQSKVLIIYDSFFLGNNFYVFGSITPSNLEGIIYNGLSGEELGSITAQTFDSITWFSNNGNTTISTERGARPLPGNKILANGHTNFIDSMGVVSFDENFMPFFDGFRIDRSILDDLGFTNTNPYTNPTVYFYAKGHIYIVVNGRARAIRIESGTEVPKGKHVAQPDQTWLFDPKAEKDLSNLSDTLSAIEKETIKNKLGVIDDPGGGGGDPAPRERKSIGIDNNITHITENEREQYDWIAIKGHISGFIGVSRDFSKTILIDKTTVITRRYSIYSYYDSTLSQSIFFNLVLTPNAVTKIINVSVEKIGGGSSAALLDSVTLVTGTGTGGSNHFIEPNPDGSLPAPTAELVGKFTRAGKDFRICGLVEATGRSVVFGDDDFDPYANDSAVTYRGVFRSYRDYTDDALNRDAVYGKNQHGFYVYDIDTWTFPRPQPVNVRGHYHDEDEAAQAVTANGQVMEYEGALHQVVSYVSGTNLQYAWMKLQEIDSLEKKVQALEDGETGGGLTSVATDSTLEGDGTTGDPLSVVGGGVSSVTTDDSLDGDGTSSDPLSVAGGEVPVPESNDQGKVPVANADGTYSLINRVPGGGAGALTGFMDATDFKSFAALADTSGNLLRSRHANTSLSHLVLHTDSNNNIISRGAAKVRVTLARGLFVNSTWRIGEVFNTGTYDFSAENVSIVDNRIVNINFEIPISIPNPSPVDVGVTDFFVFVTFFNASDAIVQHQPGLAGTLDGQDYHELSLVNEYAYTTVQEITAGGALNRISSEHNIYADYTWRIEAGDGSAQESFVSNDVAQSLEVSTPLFNALSSAGGFFLTSRDGFDISIDSPGLSQPDVTQPHAKALSVIVDNAEWSGAYLVRRGLTDISDSTTAFIDIMIEISGGNLGYILGGIENALTAVTGTDYYVTMNNERFFMTHYFTETGGTRTRMFFSGNAARKAELLVLYQLMVRAQDNPELFLGAINLPMIGHTEATTDRPHKINFHQVDTGQRLEIPSIIEDPPEKPIQNKLYYLLRNIYDRDQNEPATMEVGKDSSDKYGFDLRPDHKFGKLIRNGEEQVLDKYTDMVRYTYKVGGSNLEVEMIIRATGGGAPISSIILGDITRSLSAPVFFDTSQPAINEIHINGIEYISARWILSNSYSGEPTYFMEGTEIDIQAAARNLPGDWLYGKRTKERGFFRAENNELIRLALSEYFSSNTVDAITDSPKQVTELLDTEKLGTLVYLSAIDGDNPIGHYEKVESGWRRIFFVTPNQYIIVNELAKKKRVDFDGVSVMATTTHIGFARNNVNFSSPPAWVPSEVHELMYNRSAQTNTNTRHRFQIQIDEPNGSRQYEDKQFVFDGNVFEFEYDFRSGNTYNVYKSKTTYEGPISHETWDKVNLEDIHAESRDYLVGRDWIGSAFETMDQLMGGSPGTPGNGNSGLTTSQVNALIVAGVLNWARTSNTDHVPTEKIPATIARTSAVADSFTDGSVSGQNLTLTRRSDSNPKVLTLPSGLTTAQVNALIVAGVLNWARAGNTDDVPVGKIPATIARTSAVADSFIDGSISGQNLTLTRRSGSSPKVLALPEGNPHVYLTQAEYDALASKDATTIYLIPEA